MIFSVSTLTLSIDKVDVCVCMREFELVMEFVAIARILFDKSRISGLELFFSL